MIDIMTCSLFRSKITTLVAIIFLCSKLYFSQQEKLVPSWSYNLHKTIYSSFVKITFFSTQSKQHHLLFLNLTAKLNSLKKLKAELTKTTKENKKTNKRAINKAFKSVSFFWETKQTCSDKSSMVLVWTQLVCFWYALQKWLRPK